MDVKGHTLRPVLPHLRAIVERENSALVHLHWLSAFRNLESSEMIVDATGHQCSCCRRGTGRS